MVKAYVILLAGLPAVFAQAPLWGQCGGIGWTGATTCASGSYCSKSNDYYSQCIPGTSSAPSAPSATVAPPTQPTQAPPSGSGPRYIFSFGDSYTQTGFVITGTKPSTSAPLGNPAYPGWTSSGGANWLGFLSTEYNPVPVLTYNFAVGGATIDPAIVNSGTPVTTQVSTFLSNLGGATRPSYAPWTSANSVFTVWIGINDLGNTHGQGGDQSALHTRMIDSYFRLMQNLYNVGARNFLFLSIPPTDKSPLFLAQSAASRASLATQLADFNNKLRARATTFASANSGTRVYNYDTASAFNKVIASPGTYGFRDATSACTSGCMWWDTYHPAAPVHRLVAQEVNAVLRTGFW